MKKPKDKRHFRRYRKGLDFAVRLDNRYFHAKVTDYSLDGLGLIIEDPPQIDEGDIIDVRIEEPAISTEAEVVWKSSTPSGLRLGLRNVGHLEGLLRDYSFADTLLGIQGSGKTGILTVEHHGTVKKVYIQKGDLVFSFSNHKKDSLADMLLSDRKISVEQYNILCRETVNTHQKEGALLVGLGYCEPKDLLPLVRHQIEEIVLSLFTIGDGRFFFEEAELPLNEIVRLKLSAIDLIYSGTKRIEDVRHIAAELPSLDVIPAFVPDLMELFPDLKLDEAGRKVLASIDGKTPAGEIISLTGLDRLEVLRTLFALINIRMVEVKAGPQRFKTRGGTTRGKQGGVLDPEVVRMIEEMHGKYLDLGYYGVLDVRPHASLTEIKSAYYRAAKMFHPDIHFSRADDTLKDKLSDIFSYVYEAYSTLTDPEKRKDYDKSLSVKQVRTVSGGQMAKTKFEEGRNIFRQGKYPEAELLFGQAAYYDSNVAEYHYYYGLSLLNQKKMKAAEKAIARALKIDPFNPEYLSELGFVFLELGFPLRARGLFEKALKYSPDNGRAVEGMVRVKEL